MLDELHCILYAGDVIEIVVEQGGYSMRFLANYARLSDTIRLNRLHIESEAPSRIPAGLFKLVAQAVLEFLNAQVLEILGAKRTTGSTPGRIPGPVRYERK
jgi:hypothetical protein